MYIAKAASLLSNVVAAQRPTVAPPPTSAGHLTTPILQEYAYNSFHVEVGPDWPLASIHKAITTAPHTSTLTPSAISFYRTDILDISLRGFSIILSEEDAICLFGTLLCISCLALVDQQNRKPRLICNF